MPEGFRVYLVTGPFRASMAALLFKVDTASELGADAAAKKMVDAIHRHMHGRPGPNYISGNLYSSVRTRRVRGATGFGRWGREVYMDEGQAPYAARIELGFRGPDALGRVFDQPPYPYFRPGVEGSHKQIEATLVKYWGSAIEGA